MSTASVAVASRPDYGKRGFWAFIATLFQGAFNDNLYRWIITYYLFNRYTNPETGALDPGTAAAITSAGAILFSIPYIVFPGIAGALADRYSKRTITIATKAWEVMVMILGLVAFKLDVEPVIWFMLFLMNMQSAFFSPAKYGILPEILPESRLSWGNGVLNMATFVAIVTGTAFAGVLFGLELTIFTMSAILIGLSCIGLTMSLFVTRAPAANPHRRIPVNPWAGMGQSFKYFYTDNVLFLMLLAGSFFWFAGALLQQNIPVYATVALGLDELHTSIMLGVAAVGIGVGSIAAGYLSRRKIELGITPMGMAGVALFGFLLFFTWHGFLTILVLLFLTGFFSGFYVVPINATVQHRSPVENRGRMIAAFNVANSVGIFLAGGLYQGGAKLAHISPHQFFLMTGLLTLAVGAYLCVTFPTFILRWVLWLLTNTIYRLRVKGAEHVPERGGALLVAPQPCCVDALVVAASLDRPVRFVMAESLFAPALLKPLAKVLGIRPAGKRRERAVASPEAHLAAAAEAIRNGELVCIFTQGIVTPSGQVLPFREVLDAILNEVDAPVIPVFVDPSLVQVFEAREDGLKWDRPPWIPYRLAVCYHAPMASDASAYAIVAAIEDAGTQMYSERLWDQPLLHRAFIKAARRHPRFMGVVDARTPALSFFKTLVGSIILGRKLRPLLGEKQTTGILLPPSVGGALANISLEIMGKVPVNLNYTASAETMAASARQADLTHVITARAFLERLPLKVPGEAIYLEDVMKSVTKKDRFFGILMALFAPIRLIERRLGSPPNRSEHDLATIVFSSGSEGEPKGVMLTHFGVMTNIEAIAKIFPHRIGQPMMGILPFFHSFGFTATLWLPLTHALGAVYHPNPLEARVIGGLIKKHRPNFFVATPTFLQNFVRRCAPDTMRSLDIVMTGAEKLPDRVRDAFREKFGIEPLEGYGVTECSPAVSSNVPDFNIPGFYREGNRRGSVGRPFPGVAAHVVDVDTREPLPPNVPGLLFIKGPNIMKGYLGMPERTEAVIKDGWYETGDIAAIDEDGFITLTDRLARFSKVGGEMVPHIKIEEALHQLLGLTEQTLAVAAVPDPTKGERLVVLHTLEDDQLDELLGKLDKAGLPNLWRPRPNAFYRIDEIPVLGTGKMDIKAVKNLAKKLDLGD